MALTDIQYDSIMRDYSRRKLANQALADQRLSEVYDRAPQVRKYTDELTALSITEARNRLNGVASEYPYEESLRTLTHLRTQALMDAGYPADYLDPIYDCPLCQDTGHHDGHRCECFRRKMIALIGEQTGMQQILEEDTFANLRTDYYSAAYIDPASGRTSLDIMTHEVIPAAHEFVRCFGKREQNLLFYGNCGTGKTFISHCIGGELLRQGYQVLQMTSFELFDALSRDHFSNSDAYSPVVDSIFNSDLLIIDDLGTELLNNFVTSEFFYLLDDRLRFKRSTIISTNLTLADLHKRYSERITSRITNNYKLLKFVGDDIRTTKTLRQGQGSRP